MSEPTYTVGPSSQPSFTKSLHIEIPHHQAPHAPDHAPWMDLSAQIIFLGTRMEEFAAVSDTRFYSMEDCIDQYQTASPLSLSICSRDLSVWRIAWINIKLRLSISNRELSALRVA